MSTVTYFDLIFIIIQVLFFLRTCPTRQIIVGWLYLQEEDCLLQVHIFNLMVRHYSHPKGAVTPCNSSCNLSRNVLATLWLDKLHETFHSVTCPATAKIVAKQVARVVAESRIEFYFLCNLSRNDFGRYRVCYTVKCFLQLIPPQCRQNIARQVARTVAQCNSALNWLVGPKVLDCN